jgi:hypothetical protein
MFSRLGWRQEYRSYTLRYIPLSLWRQAPCLAAAIAMNPSSHRPTQQSTYRIDLPR